MGTNNELKDILTNFIKEQKEFNDEQRQFNSEQREFNGEQRQFNKEIDKKIDKAQYFLEETIAEHTKMFFSEQMELKWKVDSLNTKMYNLKNDLINLSSQFKLLQRG